MFNTSSRNDKEQRSPTSGVLILIYGTNTNYRKWAQEMSDYMMTIYKYNASFTIDEIYPTYPEITLPTNEEVSAENDPFGAIKAAYIEKCRSRSKNIEILEKDRYAIWAELMKHIIEISRDRLKASDEYRASELNNRNPLSLWKDI